MQKLNVDSSVILKSFNSGVAETNSSKADMFEHLRMFGPKLHVTHPDVCIGMLTFLSAPG